MRVQVIVFGDEGISIEYTDESDGEFPKSSQITIPYRVVGVEKYPELSNDITEVIQDVDSLLDSAILASMNKVSPRQMGVE